MQLIITVAMAAFVLLLLLQAVVWSLVRIRREMLGLLVVYGIFPAVLTIAGVLWSGLDGLTLLATCLLYAAIASAYIQTYPTLREDIPTFRLLFAIDDAGQAGADETVLAAHMDASSLYNKKIDDLLHDGLVMAHSDGSLSLRPGGRFLARMFRAYRRLLGMEKGLG